MTQRKNL